jgi:hypothetical protein
MLRGRGLRQCLNGRVYQKFSSKQEPEVSSNQSQSGWNWKESSVFIITGACALLETTYKNKDAIVRDLTRHLSPSDIQHSSTTSVKLRELESKESYIHRPDLENKINSILHRENATPKYFVVYGPKGVGKSVLIAKCVDGKKGVVKVIIGSVFQKSDILQVLSTKLMGEGSPAVNEEDLHGADACLPQLLNQIHLDLHRDQSLFILQAVSRSHLECRQIDISILYISTYQYIYI